MEKIQNELNKISSGDYKIIDVEIKYFGDEIFLVLENALYQRLELHFTFCYKVHYNKIIKNQMIKKIAMEKYMEVDDFYEFTIELLEYTINIICKNLTINKL